MAKKIDKDYWGEEEQAWLDRRPDVSADDFCQICRWIRPSEWSAW